MRHTFLIMLLVIAGCDSAVDPNDPGEIIVTISSDKSSFSVQNPVEITVIVENHTDTVFTLYPATSCVLSSAVMIEGQPFPTWRICLQSGAPVEISPGDSLMETWLWDGVYVNAGEIHNLEPGTYELVGIASEELTSNPISLEHTSPDSVSIPENSVFIIPSGADESSNFSTFTLGNTTQDTYQYYGYSYDNLYHHTQYLNGDSWEYLFYNWCATGDLPP